MRIITTIIILLRSDVVARSLCGLVLCGVACGAAVACSSSSSGSDAADASAADAAQGALSSHADAASLVHADACQKANGVCAPSGTCAKAGGATAGGGGGGCVMDTGTAECCVPPKPVFDPKECNGEGGVCTSFAACDETHGYHSSDTTCGGAGFVCCVPHATCGDATFSCCGGSGEVSPPYCNAGELQCPPQSNQCAGAGDQ